MKLVKFVADNEEVTKQIDLRVVSVEDYNRYIGVSTPHSLVSVVHYDELPPLRHSRTLWGIYAIFLLDDTEETPSIIIEANLV